MIQKFTGLLATGLCCVTDLCADKHGPDSDHPLSEREIALLDSKAIVDILVSLGLAKSRASKINQAELRELIKGLSACRTECFRKHFARAVGFSGGTLDCVCRHLVMYASKAVVFSESPADAVAVLTLFKHLPHACFYDYWCGAVRQLSSAAAKAGVDFGARAGALLLDDDLKTHADQLPLSIPALNPQSAPSFSLSDRDHERKAQAQELPSIDIDRPAHPLTQCKVCLLLHDRLHGEAHVNCPGRDPNNVLQLLGLSTESAEHFNSLRTRHDRFLRNESPQRNLFLHKVIAYLRNRKINLQHLERLKKELEKKSLAHPEVKWRLSVTEFGQLRVIRV